MVNKQFEPEKWQIESGITFTNDMGIEKTNVCPVDNIVRWRKSNNPDDELSAKTQKKLTKINDIEPNNMMKNNMVSKN